MPDRRNLLRGLVALPAAVAVTPAKAGSDPVTVARRDWLAARAHYRAAPDDTTNDMEEALWDVVDEAERRAITARPRTIAGAIDALEWASAEMQEHHGTGVQGDDLILALVDGALGVLRMLETAHG